MVQSSNRELCLEFFTLLTTGFYITGEFACSDLMDTEEQKAEILRCTRAWRNDMWKKFYEVEERLCPRPPNAPRIDYGSEIKKRAGK